MISIIIPCFNTINILKNNLADLIYFCCLIDGEIIIIDDGSYEDVEKQLKDFLSESVIVYRQENKGVSAARNKGIEISTKDNLLFLDSDDVINFDVLKNYTSEIIKNDFCYWNGIKVYPNKENITYEILAEDNASNLLHLLYRRQVQIFIGGFCVKRKIAEKVRFDESIKYGEDLKFIFEVLSFSTKICYLENVKLSYLQRSDSAIYTFNDSRFDSQQAINSIHLHSFYENIAVDRQYLLKRDGVVIIRTLCKAKKIAEIPRVVMKSHKTRSFIRSHFGMGYFSYVAFFLYILLYKSYIKTVEHMKTLKGK